jgi:hypothetical protein
MDVECLVCTKVSRPEWEPLFAFSRGDSLATLHAKHEKDKYNQVMVEGMRCAHEDCEQLLIRINESRPTAWIDGGGPILTTDTWIARPRFGETTRPVDALIGEPYRTDYLEAAAILEISPRMAAVLARRIVGDLLKDYAKKKHWSLTARIRSFINDGGHPSSLTTNLEHLREIADFGAHTQEAEQESESGEMEVVIIDADREDAEWTLDLVDRLF